MLKQCYRIVARLLLLAIFLLSGPFLQAQESKVFYVVKLPPPKILCEQLMGLVRQVSPGPQIEMMPMMLLGAYGYPQFPGVSETEPVTIFFFQPEKGEVTPPFVLMAKMAPDAPMRRSLTLKVEGNNTMMGMLAPGLEVQERDGWTLFANDALDFDYAQDVKSLAKMSREVTGFDITARIYIGPDRMAEWTEHLKHAIADEHARLGKDASDPQLMRWQSLVDFAATIGENLEWAQAGLDINEETVSIGMAALAIEGTPEGEILSAPVGGPAPVAKLLPMSTLSYVVKVNMDAGQKYVDSLAERALKTFPGELKPYIERFRDDTRKLASRWGDSMTATMAFEGLGKNKITSVMHTDVDYAEYNAMMRFNFDEFFPFLLEYFGDEKLAQGAMVMQLKDEVAEVAGQPVDALEMTTEQMEFNWDDPAAEPQTVRQTDTTYYVIADGALVSASSLEALEAVVKRVASKTPADNNLAEHIQLEKGQMLGLELALADLIQLFVKELEPETEVAKQALRKLATSDLEPVTASIRTGDNHMLYQWTAPVSSIAAISETVRTIQQAEKEMDYGEPNPKKAPPEASKSKPTQPVAE